MKGIFKQFFCTKKGEHPPVLDGVFYVFRTAWCLYHPLSSSPHPLPHALPLTVSAASMEGQGSVLLCLALLWPFYVMGQSYWWQFLLDENPPFFLLVAWKTSMPSSCITMSLYTGIQIRVQKKKIFLIRFYFGDIIYRHHCHSKVNTIC
jgi:hypothetical protein